MEIKPIKLVQRVKQAEVPDSRIHKELPSVKTPLTLPSGRFHFAKGELILNGKNIGTIIEEAVEPSTAFWSQLANDLNIFLEQSLRKQALQKKRKKGDKGVFAGQEIEDIDPTGELGHLAALVEAYIAKIMRILKRKYDETADGLSYTLDEDGQLILNGMNVNSFVIMAQQYPSDKAKLFLKGLKNRLSVILSNKGGNPNYEKIRDATLNLFKEIDCEIKRIVEKERLIENI